MGRYVRFLCVLSVCLALFGQSSRETRGFEENKLEDESEFFPDEILDALEGKSLGVELVPLAQVREEFEQAKKHDAADAGDDAKGKQQNLDFSLEGLVDAAARNEEYERTHPLVPCQGNPCSGDGLVVASVTTHGPAFEAGIRRSDVIYSINGKKVATLDEFQAEFDKASDSVSGNLKLAFATYDPKKGRGVSETSPQAWKRKTVLISPNLARYTLMAPLERTPDAVRGNDHYSHRDETLTYPDGVLNLAFVRKVNSKPSDLLLNLHYQGDSWIFINQATIRADDQVFEFDFKSKDAIRNVVKGGGVIESFYFHGDTPKHKKLIQAVVNSRKVLVRLSGKNRAVDVEVPVSERAKMLELYNIYRELGGV